MLALLVVLVFILTADEQRITREDCPVVPILKQIADAVLSVTRGVQRLHLDSLTDGESLAMARSLRDLVAVLPTDDRNVVRLERLGIAACVVVVAGRNQ